MAKPKKLKAKFLSFKVKNAIVKRQSGITKKAEVYGKIKTTNNKGVVDITMIPPKPAKEATSRALYGKARESNTVNFNWFYTVLKSTKEGTYRVEGILRENEKQRRVTNFRVA